MNSNQASTLFKRAFRWSSSGHLWAMAVAIGLALPSASQAFSFGAGVKGGVNLANAEVDGIDDTEIRPGAIVGGFAEFGVTSPYSVVLEALWSQKGANFNVVGNDVEGRFTYLEFPLLLKAKFGSQDMHGYAFAGPNLGINLTAEGSADNAFGTFQTDIEENTTAIDFTGDVGLGGSFRVAEFVRLMADVRYSFGFNNVFSDPVFTIDEWRSRDIKLMVGVLFHLIE